jgi:tyrosine-protein phosphatase YwqE
MKLTILKLNNIPIAILESIESPINSVQDALDLLENANSQGIRKIMIKKEHLHKDFFNLKSGLAGEIIQKVINYYKQLAIVGDFDMYQNKSWLDFVYESNKTGQIFFAENTQDAVKLLTKD